MGEGKGRARTWLNRTGPAVWSESGVASSRSTRLPSVKKLSRKKKSGAKRQLQLDRPSLSFPSMRLSARVCSSPSRFSTPLLPLEFVHPPPLLPPPRRSADPLRPQFLNRTKSLSLYRAFIRSTRGLGDLHARRETVAWVRHDFERLRDVVDAVRFPSRRRGGPGADADSTAQEKAQTLLGFARHQLKQLNSAGMLVGNEGDKWRGGRKP